MAANARVNLSAAGDGQSGLSCYAAIGISPSQFGGTLLSNVPVLAKTGPGELYSFDADIVGSPADVFIQIFDAAATSAVTLGSTPPRQSYRVPAGGFAPFQIAALGVSFQNGCVVAATGNRLDATTPPQTPACHFYFK